MTALSNEQNLMVANKTLWQSNKNSISPKKFLLPKMVKISLNICNRALLVYKCGLSYKHATIVIYSHNSLSIACVIEITIKMYVANGRARFKKCYKIVWIPTFTLT
jgi:hypothetical protein